MSLPCGCEPGVAACEIAERRFLGYRILANLERELFLKTCEDDCESVTFEKWRAAQDAKKAAYRKYRRHVDGEQPHLRPVA